MINTTTKERRKNISLKELARKRCWEPRA